MKASINWVSDENLILMNPRFPRDEGKILHRCASEVAQDLKGHIFLLSSGTTAVSFQDLKWVVLSKQAFLASAAAVNTHLESTQKDIWLQPLPEFHVGGLSIWARSALSGAKVVSLEKWSVGSFLELVTQAGVTLSSLVPTQVYDLVSEGRLAPASLRAILVGGGALSPVLYAKARDLGWPVLPTYGMTETCSQVATAALDTLKEGIESSDVPPLTILSHFVVKTGHEGQLYFKGDSLLTGYVFAPESEPASSRLSSPLTEEGWFVSQDLGAVEGSNLRVLGRQGEFVKIGGESVGVRRLSEVLERIRLEIEFQGDLALVPVPDERLGHVIHLLVEVLEDQGWESSLVSLIEKFNSQVLAFEKIRKTVRLKSIPRNALGKVCYRFVNRPRA